MHIIVIIDNLKANRILNCLWIIYYNKSGKIVHSQWINVYLQIRLFILNWFSLMLLFRFPTKVFDLIATNSHIYVVIDPVLDTEAYRYYDFRIETNQIIGTLYGVSPKKTLEMIDFLDNFSVSVVQSTSGAYELAVEKIGANDTQTL